MKESLINETKTSKSKGLGIFALVGVCVVAVASFMGGYETHSPIGDEAALASMSYMIEHQKWLLEQHDVLGDLIEEGMENQIAIAGALAIAGKSASFAKMAGPII